MREATLVLIAPLLRILRANPALSEVRPTVFHLDGRDFVHFHDDPDGVVADVRPAKGVVRVPVSSPEGQAELLDQIDECLSSVGSRTRDRARRGGLRRHD
jgi:hypothetical protein